MSWAAGSCLGISIEDLCHRSATILVDISGFWVCFVAATTSLHQSQQLRHRMDVLAASISVGTVWNPGLEMLRFIEICGLAAASVPIARAALRELAAWSFVKASRIASCGSLRVRELLKCVQRLTSRGRRCSALLVLSEAVGAHKPRPVAREVHLRRLPRLVVLHAAIR
jgi:hypothetical protein